LLGLRYLKMLEGRGQLGQNRHQRRFLGNAAGQPRRERTDCRRDNRLGRMRLGHILPSGWILAFALRYRAHSSRQMRVILKGIEFEPDPLRHLIGRVDGAGRDGKRRHRLTKACRRETYPANPRALQSFGPVALPLESAVLRRGLYG
jgi:hypothetical protein